MEYAITIIGYFSLLTLGLIILGYNVIYNQRVGQASQRLGIVLPRTLKRFLHLITLFAFVFLLIISFFLVTSIILR